MFRGRGTMPRTSVRIRLPTAHALVTLSKHVEADRFSFLVWPEASTSLEAE